MNDEKLLRQRALDAVTAYYRGFLHTKKEFTPGDRLCYGGRIFDEEEIRALTESCLDFWLTSGRFVKRFEKEFTEFIGVRHCALVNSGSSANLLAFMALTSPSLGKKRIRPGDEVITLAAGFPTTVSPIIQYGAIPVFVDIELPRYNIDCDLLEGALSEKTKAVMIAHTLGNPFDAKRVRQFCEDNGLWLIEDNCDALGSKILSEGSWKYTGTFGHLATSSFYPPHHMTMGEGGAVYTDDTRLFRLVTSFRDWGRDCWCESGQDNTCKHRFDRQFGLLPRGYDHKYVYSHFGYNLKVTEMQAAIGCAQLKKLPGFIEARKKNWEKLLQGLRSQEKFFLLPEKAADTDPSWFGFLLTIGEGAPFTRDDIVNHLEGNGVQTRMLFAGNLLRHPCFDELRSKKEGFRVSGTLDNSDLITERTFWLGVYPGLDDTRIGFMINCVEKFCGRY
ncbi:MAG: lipopolysaccharide biosynthesis protein RfbH [Deltaproteobacteria bacterium]|nr:MAG: lipopolysaccharide biosynthesis protein RfbH [Deltaproteobacteria bacterium]